MSVLDIDDRLVGNHSSYRANITAGSLKITESRVNGYLERNKQDYVLRCITVGT